MLTSYSGANLARAELKKVKWHFIVIDEAHRIKNEQSFFSQNVRMFKTQFKLLLTGTPLQNNLHELWALLNYIVPELFKDSNIFDDMFAQDETEEDSLSEIEIQKRNKTMVQNLHKIIAPFMMRRIKKNALRDLPPKKIIHLYTQMT